MRPLRAPLCLGLIVLAASACSVASRAPDAKAGAAPMQEESPEPTLDQNQAGSDTEGVAKGPRQPLKASPYRAEPKRERGDEGRVRLPADLSQRQLSRRAEAQARAVFACLVLDRERHDLRRGRAIAAELAREKAVASSFALDGWTGEQSLDALGDRAASRKADYLLVLQEGERRAVMIFAPKDLALLARSGGPAKPQGDSALAAVFRRACRIWDAR